ncbi:hypothetical protein Ndes2526A_g07151 [Nannochloris sp. 'desiccata']
MSKAHIQALLNGDSQQVEEAHAASEKINKPRKQNSLGQRYVVAIIQNRAKEVGLAALDTTTCSTLWLAQYVEATRSFTTTLTMLELYPPDELLVVAPKDTSMPEMGLNAALAVFETTPRPRGDFDDSEGTVLVQACAMNGSFAELTSGRGSYLALGAAGALLKFMRENKSMVLAASCLHVKHALSTHHMHIDAASIEALELVQSTSSSLLNFLDGTRTRAGSQLLRANLLQPLKDIPTLNARYDALGELRSNSALLMTLEECLMQLPRKHGLDGGAESELLCVLRSAVADPIFAQLLMRLEGLLEDDVYSARGAFLNRAQQCFALRCETIPMLEIARQVFCKTTEAVHEHASEMRDQHELDGLKAKYTAKRGFYFEIHITSSGGGGRGGNGGGNNGVEHSSIINEGEESSRDGKGGGFQGGRKRGRGAPDAGNGGISSVSRLPSTFSILSSNGRVVQCTTDELNALNARLRDATNDCLCLTEEALDGVSSDIIAEHLPALHRLIDGLALLDMLCGFARQLETGGKDYVRPALTENTGPLALVGCRHPVLEMSEGFGGNARSFNFQENDTWLSIDSSLHVITGPNMAGKSTYLRQVAAAVVMAQVGCHVAAKFASITPLDRILTRIGTSDSLETNSSSFMVEMQETAYILRHATPQSLVLIDELGRATSTTDGLAVAWAVAEALAATGARTLLATHFAELAELANIYPQCRAWHFSVNTSNNTLDYTFELKPGRCKDKHYGLALAAAVAFPQEALERAKSVVEVLAAEAAETAVAHELNAVQQEESAVWEIVGKLACLAQAFGGGEEDGEEEATAEMLEQLKKLQQEAVEMTLG